MSVGSTTSRPLITRDELVDELNREKPERSPRTVESLIAYAVKTGRLLRVRRGLFARVPPGGDPETYPVDPFLVASRATVDAVLAYHTALEFFGRAYSTFERYDFVTTKKVRPFRFRSYEFRPVPVPKSLVARRAADFGVKEAPRDGLTVRVTSLERTMVDVLDRPDLAGGWEEVWRSLEMIEFFDLEVVLKYASLLGSATTSAKVGFYLEQHRDRLMVEEKHLKQLERQRPKEPHYMQAGSRGGKQFSRWNLIVPEDVFNRMWEE